MKKMPEVLLFVAFAIGIVFFACSGEKPQDAGSSSSSDGGYECTEEFCEPSEDSSSSSNPNECTEDTCQPPEISSSSNALSSGGNGNSSSSELSLSSSSAPVVTVPGAGCDYMPIWCGGMAFSEVRTGNVNDENVGATELGQRSPDCIYATTITQIGNENAGISINGTKFAPGDASRCGGATGHNWGDNTSCATKFNSVAKKDGGYYIYVPEWAGQNFITTGGNPVCSGAPGTSSPSQSLSSSSTGSGGGSGNCIEPTNNVVPPGGVTSCIVRDGNCYTCNPDRGNECNQGWIWGNGGNVGDNYWYKKVECSAGGTGGTLECKNLATTGVAGLAITQPTVTCNGTAATGVSYTGAPAWNNPVAGPYTVSATANCGGSSKTASCGTITGSALTTNTLTCTGLASTGTVGTAITQPTVRCGNNSVANPTFTGAPVWNNPIAGTYTVSATANCGSSNQTASCNTIRVTASQQLTCGSVAGTITVGQSPNKPNVACGATTLTTGITWAPSAVNNFGAINTAQTINNVTATASCGGSNQTAACSGTITVIAAPSSSSGGSSGYTPKAPGNQTAKTTQYWDACKPSCSWSGKGGLQANSCNIGGSNIGHSDGDKSSCDGGTAFTCMSQAPWKVGNVSFGYAAINMGACGDCYQLDFPNGHVMVVMKSNIGNLNEGAAFDIMIPGGGVGDFDALTRQVSNSGVSNPDMGNRYGGFRVACNNSVSCVKQKCDATFKNLADLRAGCNWYADNLGTNPASFDNPTVKYQKVDCPAELRNKY
jgi:hypothetical protein